MLRGDHRYELLDCIASGGMGVVYRAKAHGPHGFEKAVAVKQILPQHAQDHEFVRRFIAEAKIAVTLSHANIVQVFDFGRIGGSLFIAMEFVEGINLGDLLVGYQAIRGPVPLSACFQIGIDICKGLDYAHGHNVVHRDISPPNILLSRSGEVKIADFGVARPANQESVVATVVGKAGYMAPEQARGDAIDHRVDLFAAGVVMHELLCGRRLFSDRFQERAAFLSAVEHAPRPSDVRSDVTPEVDDLVWRALAPDPNQRITSASELLRGLTQVCLSMKVVPTPLELRQAIIRSDTERQDNDTDPNAVNQRLQAALAGAGVATDRIPQRRTVPGDSVPGDSTTELTGESATDVTNDVTGPFEKAELTTVIVQTGTDDTGITLWAPEVSEPEAVLVPMVSPRPPRERQAHGRRLVGLLAVGLTLVIASAIALLVFLPPTAENGGAAALPPDPVILDAAVADQALAHSAPLPTTTDARLADRRKTSFSLRIRSTPSGARVELDGVAVGVTPATITTTPGHHRLRVYQGGYRDDVQTIEVQQPTEIERTLVRLYGTVHIHVTPWAYVYYRGRKLAEAPVQNLRLPVGRHRLLLVNPAAGLRRHLVVQVPRRRPYRVQLGGR